MQSDKDSLFTFAGLLVLAALVVSQFVIAGSKQERHEAQTEKVAAVEAPPREREAETPPVDERPKAIRKMEQVYTRIVVQHEMPTAAQRAAAEEYYKKYLDPDISKVVSRQPPQEARDDTMQGFNMNKWVYFRDDGSTATLVGMGEAYLNIRPEDLNTMNYTYYSQGRLGTMIVVNLRPANDEVFGECRNSFEQGFPPEKLLTVFGYGVAERVMHDGLNDEVILNISPLTRCLLGDNYR